MTRFLLIINIAWRVNLALESIDTCAKAIDSLKDQIVDLDFKINRIRDALQIKDAMW
jgi:hypothetical protein